MSIYPLPKMSPDLALGRTPEDSSSTAATDLRLNLYDDRSNQIPEKSLKSLLKFLKILLKKYSRIPDLHV
jgi:hypothetical protein